MFKITCQWLRKIKRIAFRNLTTFLFETWSTDHHQVNQFSSRLQQAWDVLLHCIHPLNQFRILFHIMSCYGRSRNRALKKNCHGMFAVCSYKGPHIAIENRWMFCILLQNLNKSVTVCMLYVATQELHFMCSITELHFNPDQ